MSLDQDRADQICLEALERSGKDRDAYVTAECGNDDALAERVRMMIARHEGLPTSFLGGASPEPQPEPSPDRIAGCVISREIGRGGMGVVYEAQQDTPRRRVAIKVVRPGALSDNLLRRFRFEAEVLAQLEHPGIASVYEVGTDSVGGAQTPYFMMEFVDGAPLDEHTKASGLGRRETIELIARVCDAVQHAHQRGVIHRDLKPANILVRASTTSTGAQTTGSGATAGTWGVDGIGQPKVLDFGVARFADGASAGATIETQAGAIIGTLEYMSPEQLSGPSTNLDTRSDVYALGVILFRLLAGRAPHDTSGRSIADAALMLREEAPRLGSIDPMTKGDLDTIVAKAIHPDRDQRYPSAGQLADDLRRFLRNEPITAHPPSAWYQLRKFSRRNRAVVAAATAGLAMLVLGVVGTSLGLRAALVTNRELEQRNDDLQRVTEFQSARLGEIDLQSLGAVARGAMFELTEENERDELDDALGHINFTTVASQMFERGVFRDDAEKISEAFERQPRIRSSLLATLSQTLRSTGLYAPSLNAADAALRVTEDEYGPDAPETLRVVALRGAALIAEGRFDEAETAYRRAMDGYRALGPANELEMLTASSGVARSLWMKRQDDAALELVEQTAPRLRELAGDDNAATLDALGVLAGIYDGLGRSDEAIELGEMILMSRRNTLGDSSLATISAILDLGDSYRQRGDFERAKALLREAFTRAAAELGRDHPETLRAGARLGDTLYELSSLEESAEFRRDIADRSSRLLGRDHPTTIARLNAYAGTLRRLERLDEAEALYLEVIERLSRTLGAGHRNTLAAKSNLAGLLRRTGKIDESLALMRESYEGLLALNGEEHPDTLLAMGNLGVHLLNSGNDQEAEPLIIRAYAVHRRILGNEHPSTLFARYNVCRMLIRLERLDEAESHCVGAYEGHNALDPSHTGTLFSLGQLVDLRTAQGRLDEALALATESVERCTERYGPDHALTQRAQEQLAALRAPNDSQ